MKMSFSRTLALLVGASALLWATIYYGRPALWALSGLGGSAAVIDETGGVQAAVLIDGFGTEQPMQRLRDGYFYAVPQIEGVIQVRCAEGVRKDFGFVTGGLNTTIKVVGRSPCERLINSDIAARSGR
jgi:hypothetical protein